LNNPRAGRSETALRPLVLPLAEAQREQQSGAPSCLGGQATLPYEQNTQQSPGFGVSSALHCSHSWNHRQASVGMVSSFAYPHAGHVRIERRTGSGMQRW
jgi:hypothetical protein